MQIDLKINVGHSDLYFMLSDFVSYFEERFMAEYRTLGSSV